jgi:hypothetical protein
MKSMTICTDNFPPFHFDKIKCTRIGISLYYLELKAKTNISIIYGGTSYQIDYTIRKTTETEI